MINNNLPVIVLRQIVILPHTQLKIEISNAIDIKIINLAKEKHEGKILLVSPERYLEETIDVSELPKIGVVSKIIQYFEKPDGKIKIIIEGNSRAFVNSYLPYPNEKDVLEAVIESPTRYAIEKRDEETLIRKLLYELDNFINLVHYFSNSIFAKIDKEDGISKLTDIIADYLVVSFERKLKYLSTINPHTRVMMVLQDIQKEIDIYEVEKNIEGKLKTSLDKSQKEYILREKIRLIKEELGDISTKEEELEDINKQLKSLKAPKHIIDKIKDEIKKYDTTPSSSPEIAIIRNYIDMMLSLPWNTLTVDNTNLIEIKKVLDESHDGLDKIKDRIIEYIATKQKSKKGKTPIICLVGPPGVGKTSLAKSISNSLNRKFVKISVGGVNDVAEIVGHRRTYMGANPGRIISAIKKAKSNNPVFLIDEVDKMTKDIKGDPASSLLEVLDQEQNSTFFDNYIDEPYDLSKVMFILTANNMYNIPDALRDRLEIIEIEGYTECEKLSIAKRHLLPKVLEEYDYSEKEIIISDDIFLEVIRNYTKEAGVRELERLIRQVVRKITKEALEKKKKTVNIKISEKDIKNYLGSKKYFYTENKEYKKPGIVNGLSYSIYGGDILPIEVVIYKGKEEIILTGSLGDVMKESAKIALGYIKSNKKIIKYDDDIFNSNSLHINAVEGAVPKDGPSAGTALTTAIISVIKNKIIPSDIALTGEISLTGRIFPVGKIKEKLIGAYRSNIKKVYIPKENEKDLEEVPKEILKNININLVSNYDEIYNDLFKNEKK